MTDRPWKLVLLLAGIFAAGVVTGGFVTVRFGRQFLARAHVPMEQWGPNRLKLLTDRLALTPEQQEKLGPIIKRDADELAKVRNSSMTELRRIMDQMDHDIAQVLTPEQKEKFEKLSRELRERFPRLRERLNGGPRGPRDHPPGDAPPPPPGPPPDKPAGT